MGVRPPCKSKPENYTEPRRVDAAVTWSERNVWYSGSGNLAFDMEAVMKKIVTVVFSVFF